MGEKRSVGVSGTAGQLPFSQGTLLHNLRFQFFSQRLLHHQASPIRKMIRESLVLKTFPVNQTLVICSNCMWASLTALHGFHCFHKMFSSLRICALMLGGGLTISCPRSFGNIFLAKQPNWSARSLASDWAASGFARLFRYLQATKQNASNRTE